MKKLLRIISAVLCALTVAVLLPSAVTAGDDMTARIADCDYTVYSGGYFDITAETNVEGAKYQWCIRYKDETSFFAIDDTERNFGTGTAHFRFLTGEGYTYGSDWELMQYACMITAPDGRIRMTPTVNMIILPRAEFIKDVREKKLEITELSVNGKSPDRESDGVSFFNVPAGEAVSFSVAADTLGDEFLKSEAEAAVEITVEENGKTTKLQTVDDAYVPTKTGMSAVSVRADLVAKINGESVVTLDSKQIVLNVVSPDFEAYATIKTACSLLEGPYGESRKIGNLSAGESVRVITQSASWSRIISGNGTLGYVATEVLAIVGTVDSVGVLIQEPVAGVPINYNAAPSGDGYSLFATDPVTWTDKTENRRLSAGEPFKEGHVYSVSVWVEANDGKNFKITGLNDTAVSGTLNGMTAEVNKAYDQVPEKVVNVYYTFSHVHNTKRVNQIPPTCTEPGKAVHYGCICGAEFVDNRGLERITDENWGVFPPRGHKESEWMANAERHYKVCLRRECGDTIPGSRGDHTGGTATCVTRAECSVCGALYGDLAPHVFSDVWDYKDESGHAHKCTTLGCTVHTATEAHKPGPAATDKEPQVCLDCGYVIEWAKGQNPFSDVSPSDYFWDAVMWAVNASPQVTAGTTPTTFSPNAPCTRGQVVTFLWRAAGEPEPTLTENPFGDVKESDYFFRAVLWAVEKGITKGTGAKAFSPNATCTRGQIVTFLWRANNCPKPSGAAIPFSDVKTDDYFCQAVLWAVEKGITVGTDKTHFSPNATCTRAQVVTFLFRDATR